MANFNIEKDYLVEVVSSCQNRTFCEEIDLLEEKGNKVNWMIPGLDSSEANGIPNDDGNLAERKKKYGTNEKYVKEPAGFFELFCAALEDFILRILIVASILSIIIESKPYFNFSGHCYARREEHCMDRRSGGYGSSHDLCDSHCGQRLSKRKTIPGAQQRCRRQEDRHPEKRWRN